MLGVMKTDNVILLQKCEYLLLISLMQCCKSWGMGGYIVYTSNIFDPYPQYFENPIFLKFIELY